jgi:hypothetical protein
MFLEIMKRWRTVLVAIRPCVDDYFKQCSRIYSRTGDKIPVWGNCPGFMEKIETLKPSTIIFKKEPRWQKEYESFIVGVDNPEIE